MTDHLIIDGFKSFGQRTIIPMSSMNILVGINSVGKSTFIQSLLLLRKAFETSCGLGIRKFIPVDVNDALRGIHLGTVDQVLSSSSDRNKDDMAISCNNSEFIFSFLRDEPLRFYVDFPNDFATRSNLQMFNKTYSYRNSERKGPRDYQILSSDTDGSCGAFGERRYQVIQSLVENKLDKSDPRLRSNILTYQEQIQQWLDYVVPGMEIFPSNNPELQLSRIRFGQNNVNDHMNTVPESPYNFGFGVSYVLPIIVNGLAAEPGSTMIVENPEAHLHPKGQSRIGQFLSQVAVSGVQVVVETHSEHVVNGIRVNSLRSKLSPDDICLNYFTPDPDPAKHVRQIELNDRMDITDWPEGFFDQEEIDLRELRDIRKGL